MLIKLYKNIDIMYYLDKKNCIEWILCQIKYLLTILIKISCSMVTVLECLEKN